MKSSKLAIAAAWFCLLINFLIRFIDGYFISGITIAALVFIASSLICRSIESI
jgi:hypothetical protein